MNTDKKMKNPWETGTVYGGHRPAWCSVEDQIFHARNFDAKRLRAAIAWAGTGKTVRKFCEARLRTLMKGVKA